MDQKKWQRVKQLFSQASALSTDEQAQFVQQEGKGDLQLIDYVMQMLDENNHVQNDPNLTDIIANSASDLLMNDNVLSQGDMIEHFQVVNSIGQGGMGDVFLAKRIDDDFEQLVAIKVIHRKHLSSHSVQRFRRERQILASLNHKNIASFIGGGETEIGQPYIILEFVDGLPITDYCQQNKLSVEARLELFKQVMEAVIYAHQNLVVHRDIKPNNVLVNEQGEVKLLDFGIAKLIQDTSLNKDNSNELTQEFSRILTPANASPEQILGSNITTRSDVYGLGALLMHLLTEEAVFDTTASSHRSLESMIIDELPMRPSVKCLASTNKEVQQRAKFLTGDIDTIVMKALQKEPERRYSSTEHLMEDIIRHQNNYPISAKPDSLFYRTVKFVRRNTFSTALVSLFLFGLVSTAIVIVKQNVTIQKERDAAIQQAFIAKKTAQFMTDIFEAANPDNHSGESIEVRTILDKAAVDLESLVSEPLIKAQLNTTLAKVYAQIGEYQLSSTLLDHAEDNLAESMQKQTTLGDITLKYSLDNEKGNLMILKGEYDKALNFYSALVIELENETFPEFSQILRDKFYIGFQYGLATAYTYSGRDIPALEHYQNSLTRSEKLIAENDNDVDEIKNMLSNRYFGLGHSLRRTGDYSQARDILKTGIALERSMNNPPSLDLAHGLNQLASTFLKLGEFEKAETYALEGLEIRRNIHEYGHVAVVSSLGILSNIYSKQHQYNRSIKMRKEMLDMLEVSVGKSHPYYSIMLNTLGKLHILIKDLNTAQTYLDESHQGFIQKYPNGHKSFASVLVTLGDLALHKKESKQALSYLSDALQMLSEKAPEPTILMAKAHAYYSIALNYDGQNQKAMEQEKLALDIFETRISKNDKDYLSILQRISNSKQ